MSINIIKRTSTTNTTVYAGRAIKYIVIHYTAGVTSKVGTARNTASWFAQTRAAASADFIVDDYEIVQFNPDLRNRYCWAVGGSHYGTKGGSLYGIARNNNTISIEVCSSNKTGKVTQANDGNWYFTDAVVDRAVELTMHLMKEFGIDADHVIRHYDVNGKPCPGIYGWNTDTGSNAKWLEFKKRISGGSVAPAKNTTEQAIDKLVSLKYINTPDYWVKNYKQVPYLNLLIERCANKLGTYDGQEAATVEEAIQNLVDMGLLNSPDYWLAHYGDVKYLDTLIKRIGAKNVNVSYKVRITADVLNIRSGAGVQYGIKGQIRDKGIYTIVKEKDGWGLLKSYAATEDGWISLNYAKPV